MIIIFFLALLFILKAVSWHTNDYICSSVKTSVCIGKTGTSLFNFQALLMLLCDYILLCCFHNTLCNSYADVVGVFLFLIFFSLSFSLPLSSNINFVERRNEKKKNVSRERFISQENNSGATYKKRASERLMDTVSFTSENSLF